MPSEKWVGKSWTFFLMRMPLGHHALHDRYFGRQRMELKPANQNMIIRV